MVLLIRLICKTKVTFESQSISSPFVSRSEESNLKIESFQQRNDIAGLSGREDHVSNRGGEEKEISKKEEKGEQLNSFVRILEQFGDDSVDYSAKEPVANNQVDDSITDESFRAGLDHSRRKKILILKFFSILLTIIASYLIMRVLIITQKSFEVQSESDQYKSSIDLSTFSGEEKNNLSPRVLTQGFNTDKSLLPLEMNCSENDKECWIRKGSQYIQLAKEIAVGESIDTYKLKRFLEDAHTCYEKFYHHSDPIIKEPSKGRSFIYENDPLKNYTKIFISFPNQGFEDTLGIRPLIENLFKKLFSFNFIFPLNLSGELENS